MIRPARPSDAAFLPDVERSAGELFREIPELAWIADDRVMSQDDHTRLIATGYVWVAEEPVGRIIGFLAAEAFSDALHIDEIAVAAHAQRRGTGVGLIKAAAASARREGLAALTLTTFRDVAWNGPYYARLGFEVIDTAELGARLSDTLKAEFLRNLPPERRCAMRLPL